MKKLILIGIAIIGITHQIFFSAEQAAAATKCPTGQVPNYILKGKCIVATAQKTGLKEFTKHACTACHAKTSASCPVDLGAGSCSYKKMAQTVKAANGNSKSVAPSVLINLFTAYSSYMPGISTPTSAEAKKYITYLSSIKQ